MNEGIREMGSQAGGRKRHNGIIAHTTHSVFGNLSLPLLHFLQGPLGPWVW